jgi:D-alanyl-D-alanine carboxypeptidase
MAMFLRALAGSVLALATFLLPVQAQQIRPGGPALTPPAISQGMSDARIRAELDTWLSGLNRDGMFNGAVLVARDGREIYASARGVSDLVSNRALNQDTHFPLASIGKAFTHVAIAQLIQAGRLTLDTTVGEIIPDYPQEATRAATIDQLLKHRGGVADFVGPGFGAVSMEDLTSNAAYFRFVSSRAPMFAPGARETYCNGCYIVLGEIIARVTGQSYEAYVADHVFAPAGMASSGFFRRDQLPANTASFTGTPRGPDGPLMDVSEFHGYAGSAAGNAYSTLRDLLAFDNALREHRLLNSELTAQVVRGTPEPGRATARSGFLGGAPGVNAVLFGNGDWTLIVLTNREPPTAESMLSALFPLLAGPRPQ